MSQPVDLDAADLDALVRWGDLKSYERIHNPTDPRDGEDLLILVLPSGRTLRISAGSYHSEGVLAVRRGPDRRA